MLRGIAIYILLYPVCLPFFGWLFRRNWDWSDFWAALLTSVVLGVLFSVLTIYGARIPTRDELVRKGEDEGDKETEG